MRLDTANNEGRVIPAVVDRVVWYGGDFSEERSWLCRLWVLEWPRCLLTLDLGAVNTPGMMHDCGGTVSVVSWWASGELVPDVSVWERAVELGVWLSVDP